MVLYIIVRPPWKQFGYLSPSVPVFLVGFEHQFLLLWSPGLFVDRWVQMVMPSNFASISTVLCIACRFCFRCHTSMTFFRWFMPNFWFRAVWPKSRSPCLPANKWERYEIWPIFSILVHLRYRPTLYLYLPKCNIYSHIHLSQQNTLFMNKVMFWSLFSFYE